jgi:hypothetical protein
MARFRACVERVLDQVRQTHGLDPAAFNVLLVGGGTHMPAVQAEARRLFDPARVTQSRDPQQLVARGACYFCAIRNGVRFPVPALNQITRITVRDILTRTYGILGRRPSDNRLGLTVVLPRNTVCDGADYVCEEVAVREASDRPVRLDLVAVPQSHPVRTFVEVPEVDPTRSVQHVELCLPKGARVVAGQRLRVFLNPGENGVISGRADLLSQGQKPEPVPGCNVTFVWAGG